MQILNFSCKNQILTAECPGRIVVAESRKHVYAQFELDSEWNGLSVTAIFTNDFGSKSYARPLTTEPVEIPPEALVEGRLRVSLEGLGSGGEKRLPTAYMGKPLIVHRAGALIGLQPEEATPELWEQALAIIGPLSDLDTFDKSSLVAAINEVYRTGGGGTGGGVDRTEVEQIVADYLDDNPLTAADVGADPSGTAVKTVGIHNVDIDSHQDIRLLIANINAKLNAFFDGDDATLDELSEIVAYIKSNKTLIDAITISKVNVSDIINNLTTNVANKPLSAAQGVVLKGLIDDLTTSLSNYQPKGDYALRSELPKVPVQSVNGKTGAVQLAAADVGAATTEEFGQLSAEIGDIDTALNGIIAIQNGYINGGGTA